MDLPRLAVYHTWTDTQAAGWVRYTFDRRRIPYTLINDDDLKRVRHLRAHGCELLREGGNYSVFRC